MANAENGIIMHRNLFLTDYAPNGVLTASSEQAPVSNLRDQRPGVKLIFTGSTAEWVLLDLGRNYSMQHFCCYAHQPNYAGSIRIRVAASGDSGFASPLVDKTANPVPIIRRFGRGPFGSGRLGGFPTTSGRGARPQLLWVPLQDPANNVYPRVFGRYVRIDFAGIGYVGNMFVGEGYQPDINFGYDWSIEREDGSQVTDTWTSVNAIRGVQRRVLSVNFGLVRPEDAHIRMTALHNECGTSSACFAVLRPATDCPAESVNARAYGLLPSPGSIANPHFRLFSAPFKIRELVE